MHYHMCVCFSDIAFAPNTFCLCSKGGRFVPYTSSQAQPKMVPRVVEIQEPLSSFATRLQGFSPHLQPYLAHVYFQTLGNTVLIGNGIGMMYLAQSVRSPSFYINLNSKIHSILMSVPPKARTQIHHFPAHACTEGLQSGL